MMGQATARTLFACIAAYAAMAIGMTASPAIAQTDKAWADAVAAGKKDGALTLSIPPGKPWRDTLQLFQKDYPEIKLEMTEFASRDFWPRVVREREAGQYLWDLRVGGADALSLSMQKQKILAPLRPLLVHPDIIDGAKWVGGIDGMFMDDAKQYSLAFVLIEGQNVYYNKRLIPQGFDMTDLFDPKWKGKVSMADPRGGAALVTLGAMMKLFGEGKVRLYLGKQEPVVSEQPRQQIDWMASGRYPVAFGAPTAAFVEYESRGGKVEDFAFVSGGNYYTHGTGGAQYLDKAPHPAATAVFVNWLLSQDTQDKLMKANKLNSRRIDVAPSAPDRAIDPKNIGRYINGQDEEALNNQRKVGDIIKDVVK